jgi:hypothetical protein
LAQLALTFLHGINQEKKRFLWGKILGYTVLRQLPEASN